MHTSDDSASPSRDNAVPDNQRKKPTRRDVSEFSERRDVLSPAHHAIAGATAGVVSRFVVAPFDVVKIRLQTEPSLKMAKLQSPEGSLQPQLYRSMFQTASKIIREEGWAAPWKGNWAAEWLYLSYGAVQFMTFGVLKENMPSLNSSVLQPIGVNLPPDLQTFVAGALAGTSATLATYPLDLLRTRFALQGSDMVYPSLTGAICTILQEEGIRGFYRGVAPSVVQIIPYMGCMFEVHARVGGWIRATRRNVDNLDGDSRNATAWQVPWSRTWDDLVSGAIAGAISKIAVMPLDTTRKRLQLQFPHRLRLAHSSVPSYPSRFLPAILQILRDEGVRGLYRGTVPGIVKAAPGSAVTFAVVGWVEGWLRGLLAGRRDDIDE
ncbi:mitochondrial carrier [Gonapodya prolifera JEL478]|uniref:Mitochondrial carrier n=1 Tax=Gonapodya prolifera (strain JEL478) TaxID=1344416 RepID=A0A138ZZW1_GONPJ|nr:mitochondrial carrier [Gonapodya prolifera JEL478]|eukprot:KXS09815.1 mitochondrial carrier [Gonapodya prolifera JEL478]